MLVPFTSGLKYTFNFFTPNNFDACQTILGNVINPLQPYFATNRNDPMIDVDKSDMNIGGATERTAAMSFLLSVSSYNVVIVFIKFFESSCDDSGSWVRMWYFPVRSLNGETWNVLGKLFEIETGFPSERGVVESGRGLEGRRMYM